MFADAVLILCISFFTALLSEGEKRPSHTHSPFYTPPSPPFRPVPSLGILYVLVYRTDDYKRLKAIVEKQSKKCKAIYFLLPLLPRSFFSKEYN